MISLAFLALNGYGLDTGSKGLIPDQFVSSGTHNDDGGDQSGDAVLVSSGAAAGPRSAIPFPMGVRICSRLRGTRKSEPDPACGRGLGSSLFPVGGHIVNQKSRRFSRQGNR